MLKRSISSQVASGMRLAAMILLGFGIVALFFGGVAYAFFPRRPHFLGWIFFLSSSAVMVVTMKKWIKEFSAMLAIGAFNALLIFYIGHLPGTPQTPFPRTYALALTLCCVASLAVARTFTKSNLTAVDRTAVMAFLFIVAYSGGDVSSKVALTGRMPPVGIRDLVTFAVAFCCLLFAWAYDRFQSHRSHSLRPGSRKIEVTSQP
jgi:hypothetical protein